MATGFSRMPGGKGLNQAVVAARCGVDVHFCAPLGGEPDADIIRAVARQEGFRGTVLKDAGRSSDISILIVADDAENSIVSTGACADGLDIETALAFLQTMGSDDWLLLQGNLPRHITLAAAQRAGRVAFNTAPIRWDVGGVAAHCDVVIANAVEAEQVSGIADPAVSVGHLGGRTGIVTLGASGCLVHEDGRTTHHPGISVGAVDTTGAGDTFCGALTAGMARGLALDRAVMFAQRAAALSVTRPGCYSALPSGKELEALYLVP